METTHNFKVPREDIGQRLDVFLASRLKDVSRSSVKNLIDEGKALVNGRPSKPGYKVREGDSVEVSVPGPSSVTVEPETIPLDVIYEDGDIIVINKPAGLTTHPGAGRPKGTLVNALVGNKKRLSSIGAPLRAGIVHRLDKDTSGAIAVAKNDRAHLNLAEQFKEHTAGRTYVALVWGYVRHNEGTIDMPLGRDVIHRKKISPKAKKSRRAVTHYTVLKRYPGITLLELKLDTGRTHQIRVHLTALGHPVVGDQVYGKREPSSAIDKRAADAIKKVKRQCLHGYRLGLTHPSSGEFMEFEAPLPRDMEGLIRLLDEGQEKAAYGH